MQNTAPTLTTDRIILTALSLVHWPAYAAMWADPRTTQFIGGKPRTYTESWGKFSASVGLWQLLGYGYWAFTDRQSGALLGVGGLSHWERGIDALDGFPEAGWGFAPDAWGKGYATEAINAVLAWSDNVLKAPEIRCIIDPGNVVSRRVAEKLGFVQFGSCTEPIGPLDLFARKAGDKVAD
jgi:RimJ/RimL family protein N-acetyltransferase